MPDLALYQPDIPGNTGTLMRLAACLNFKLHIVEPAGFRLDDINLKRAGMDYLELAQLVRHSNWQAFENWRSENNRRLILLTTKGNVSSLEFKFQKDDLIMLGRESSGVPQDVHQSADHSILIPIHPKTRSINMALSGAMIMHEALRQSKVFPE